MRSLLTTYLLGNIEGTVCNLKHGLTSLLTLDFYKSSYLIWLTNRIIKYLGIYLFLIFKEWNKRRKNNYLSLIKTQWTIKTSFDALFKCYIPFFLVKKNSKLVFFKKFVFNINKYLNFWEMCTYNKQKIREQWITWHFLGTQNIS